ncbi:MAG: FeoB-associated Cys-rich membrane protein [Oscillospiraceae bacterium]|nr:FeoB-associated Cys-rich membrane protein [Oscillospiraceae bacterium]MBR2739329.1 FeoB-associated Cys-rich membrane protein [Oscillospiraceae bacterium]
MVDWLLSQLSTIIVLLLLAAVVAAIIVSMARDRKNGVSSCGCGCSSCPMHDKCHSAGLQRTEKKA